MEPQDIAKFESFLEYYAAIHHEGGAYSGDEASTGHREAATRLFEASRPFVESLPLDGIRNVLDVGAGYGDHCALFAAKGLKVTGLTVHLNECVQKDAATRGFSMVRMDMHFMDIPDDSYDLVWSHHSLEHSFSPLLALREWLRVLRPGGLLAVTVPPHKKEVVSGHFNVGWNVGQLMYMLGVAGYQLRTGRFLEEGYNVRALVRKPSEPVDPSGLSWMHTLRGRLPRSVQERVREAPRSLGGASFRGDWQDVSDDACHPKPLKQAPRKDR